MPDNAPTIPVVLPRPHRVLAILAVLLVFLAVGLLAYRTSERYGLQQMREDASHQLDILASAIDSEVTRHASIPSAVELNPTILALLRAPVDEQDILQPAANRFLEKLNDHLGGPAIFVLDLNGRVMASSDWIFSENMLSSNLSYMPFFRSAVSGTPARHYAVDTV
ncbi:MAG TPA: sensor histidine kinase, partial [Azonexus sp.]|nr:sensor histidine kinase [Azonexus sp.]